MAEIICIECKASVSDLSGYCPECGFPFDAVHESQTDYVAGGPDNPEHKTIVTTPMDIILRALDSVRLELNELGKKVDEIKSDSGSHLISPVDNTPQLLAEIAKKLDTLASAKCTKEVEAQANDPAKAKKKLLSAFYKTLNAPNSMFEYMFYICVVQIIFVIVNLFLVTYIITLVR